MTKADVVSVIAEEANLSKIQAENAANAFLKAVYSSPKTIIRGFGTFEWKIRKARVARNPTTGENVKVPEKKKLCFKSPKPQ